MPAKPPLSCSSPIKLALAAGSAAAILIFGSMQPAHAGHWVYNLQGTGAYSHVIGLNCSYPPTPTGPPYGVTVSNGGSSANVSWNNIIHGADTYTLTATATLTWTKDNANDISQPPQQVVVLETATASAGIVPVEPPGAISASDGLADPSTGGTQSQTSSGSHVWQHAVPAGTTTLTMPMRTLISSEPYNAGEAGGTISYTVTTLGASLSGNSTINTSPWDLNWPRFFSGTKCTINGNAVAASGYVTSAQLSIAGTTVNQYTDTGTHKTSLSIADTFDSTHFANNALVTYKMTVQDSGGNSYYLTGQGPTLNKGYGVVNTDGDFNPGIAAAVLGNMINYAQSPSAGDSKATINSNLPNYTAFYIATHGNSTGFGDGSIVGGQSPLPYYQQHFIAYQATSPDIGVTNDITVKAANPNLPPYNLVDIDACNSAGNGAAASTGATSFGINSSDRALLGWNAEEYTSNYAWVARVWNNLALGMTLKDAVNAATSKGRPSGPDANNHPVPINGVILGDSATKLHGVYGGAGLAWHLP